MAIKTKVNVSEASDLAPLDLLICENCGREVTIPAEASSEIVCSRCQRVMDKSLFSPVIRKQRLWVSKKALELRAQQMESSLDCNCVAYYREVVRFRQAIFEMYEKEGEIKLAQAVAMIVAFHSGFEEGVLKLLGSHDKVVKQALWQGNWVDSEELNEGFLWDWLGTMQIKRGLGRPARTDTLVLFLDAIVLMWCPNRYVHFLRDALRLRSQKYKVRPNRASAHREASPKFWKAKRAVEVSCKRKWRELFGEDPEPPPQDWWLRVARQQGLAG